MVHIPLLIDLNRVLIVLNFGYRECSTLDTVLLTLLEGSVVVFSSLKTESQNSRCQNQEYRLEEANTVLKGSITLMITLLQGSTIPLGQRGPAQSGHRHRVRRH